MPELLSRNSDLIDCLFLVMNGVPFDVAFTLDEEMRRSFVVIIGQLKGLRYDWTTGRWSAPS